MRALPVSFTFFLIASLAAVLQTIPVTNIFLMFLTAPLWAGMLINLGMIGTAFEAAIGHVSRLWLILPLAWFGLYAVAVARDDAALKLLRDQISASNAKVHVPFDPARHALVSVANRSSDGNTFEWIVQKYSLPVVYTYAPAMEPKEAPYLAIRLISQADCGKVRETPGATGAGILTSGIFDDQPARFGGRFARDFCILRQPESPVLPQVRVTEIARDVRVNSLPTVQTVTVISTPDGVTYRLRGGHAASLRRLPMFTMGCGTYSKAGSWNCDWGFLRANYTPLLDNDERGGDSPALAAALGLHRVVRSERRGAPTELVAALIERSTAKALAANLADLDRITAEPNAKIDSVPFRVLSMRPDVLATRAEQIMRALEGAVDASVVSGYSARDNGRSLGGLVANLPAPQFEMFGPRILALYGSVGYDHWLWENEPLLRRIGDLGAAAIPILIQPSASGPNVNGAGIEALCRIGSPARNAATGLLTGAWAKTRDGDRDERRALFVAMRRIGIPIPPLVEDGRGQMTSLLEDWKDVTPASPRRVCQRARETGSARREVPRSSPLQPGIKIGTTMGPASAKFR